MKWNLLGACILSSLVLTACVTESSDTQAKSLVTLPSALSVEATANKLNTILQSKGLTVFARINHAANASKAALDLRPTELIIFGNPKVGTPVMQCAQAAGIDLPQKMLIWQDAKKQVWLSYNHPEYLKQRHNIKGCDKVLEKISGVLSGLSEAATSQ